MIMHETNIPAGEKVLVYFLYIAISCLFTSGLNIIHAEYLLNIVRIPAGKDKIIASADEPDGLHRPADKYL